MLFTEPICLKWESLMFKAWIVNELGDTLETHIFDMSPLLYDQQQPSIQWRVDRSQIDELCSLQITLESYKPLLSPFLRRKLNPMLVTV